MPDPLARSLCSAAALFAFLAMLAWPAIGADPPALGSASTLELGFEDTLVGSAGETPLTSSGVSFLSGVQGQGALFGADNEVRYSSSGNIDGTVGSLSFWIQPGWSAAAGEAHWVLRHGALGGMLVGFDSNSWRIILNRWGGGGMPELGVAVGIGDWTAGQWHHAAFNWGPDRLELFLDGVRVASEVPFFSPPSVAEADLQLGADGDGGDLIAVLDELVITDGPLSEQEVLADFVAGLTVHSISMVPPGVELLESWLHTPEIAAQTNLGTLTLPVSLASAISSDPTVASVSSIGRVVAVEEGSATITYELNGQTADLAVEVVAPVLAPSEEAVPTSLGVPASGHLYEIPVVVLRYLPTVDGVNVDSEATGWTSTLDELAIRIDAFDHRVKFMLEEGSRFRGYDDLARGVSAAPPSLGYRVVRIVNVYEPMPPGFEVPWNEGWYRPDYDQILTRFDVRHWVEDRGVKEFWVWGYHHGGIEPAESNMSSPITGDVSNSEGREDDLPILRRSYTVYNYSFTRSQAEAVHNHGHQLEAILGFADERQHGNRDLFWNLFVGRDNDEFVTGRCGWTHMPPNTTQGYDYTNATVVQSDCEDWRPDGTGSLTAVNADTWGSMSYPWPTRGTEAVPQQTESQFYMYWMQNMPGRDNSIPHGAEAMTNWWLFTADWDEAMRLGFGLHGEVESPPPLIFRDDFEYSDVALWSKAVGLQ